MDKKRLRIHQDVPISIILLALSAFIFSQTIGMNPGASRFPRLALAVFVVLMIWVLADGIRKSIAMTNAPDGRDHRLLKWEQIKMPFALYGIIVLYVVLMRFVGFFIATAVFIPVVMLFFRCFNIKLIAGVTAGTLLFVYILFVKMLHASLP